MKKYYSFFYVVVFTLLFSMKVSSQSVFISCNKENDLYHLLLQEQDIDIKRFETPMEAIERAPKGSGVIITASEYPFIPISLEDSVYAKAHKKNLRLYVEFVRCYPGVEIEDSVYVGNLERGVVSSNFFEPRLKEMDLLGLNDCHIYKAKVREPLISYAKVAGFDVAQFGLADTEVFPLLFKDGDNLVSLSCLTNFKTARYEPTDTWKSVWNRILAWLMRDERFALRVWGSDPRPSYGETDLLPKDARRNAVRKGAEWIYKGKFLVHPSWKGFQLEKQGDGTLPVGPPVRQDWLVGDGLDGVLEGHASTIYYDGTQQYRYWLRNDVQGEVAFLLASAADLLDEMKYTSTSERLMNYMFYRSKFREGAKSLKDSASYGLLGWSDTHPYVFYNDDNARSLLGVIGASALLGNGRWNKFVVECILANWRTCSRQGFQGERLEEPDLLAKGWRYFNNRDYTNPHPHFESWMWACYLWLYDKTGYKPLLEKAKTAIRITMEAYPDRWGWTNGIQQERARMILPLAWLVRVEDTEEHRKWLDIVIQKLLENQVACGAIREELGSGTGMFGATRSNKDYGLTEAPLIAENGDPVADMLYTTNFAFFALNEAAFATGNIKYKEAVEKISDFLIRIQARSENHPDMDGAWMRAFDYDRWDYWASNADAGWGAWATLTGWIQSWIVGTQVLLEKGESYWDMTKNMNVKDEFEEALWMVED